MHDTMKGSPDTAGARLSKPTGKSGVDNTDVTPSGKIDSTSPSASNSEDEGTGELDLDIEVKLEPVEIDVAFPESEQDNQQEDKIQPLEDLHTPERKLVLNDLFDSAPLEGAGLSLTPPNPTAFWSSKPPPPRPDRIASDTGSSENAKAEPKKAEQPAKLVTPDPPMAEPAQSEPAPVADIELDIELSDPPADSATTGGASTDDAADDTDSMLRLPDIEEPVDSVEETIPLDLQKGPSPLLLGISPSRPPGQPPISGELPPPATSTSAPAKREAAITLQSTPSAKPTGSGRSQQSTGGSQPPGPPPGHPAANLPAQASQKPTAPVTVEPVSSAPATPPTDPQSAPPAAGQSSGVVEAAAVPAPAPAKVTESLPSVVVAGEENSHFKAARAAKATMIIKLPPGFNQPGGPSASMLASAVAGIPIPPPAPAEETEIKTPNSKNGMWVAAMLMFGLAASLVGYRFVVPTKGTLVVTAQGPGGAPVAGVSISIQGLTCSTSPCIISQIQPGQHIVSVQGTGVEADLSTVEIEAGKEVVHNVLLRPLGAGHGTREGSVRIEAAEQELILFIDRSRVGKLPRTIASVAAGRHWLALKTTDGEEQVGKWITVEAGERLDVSPYPAPTTLGSVTISLKSSSRGAAVTLDDAFLLDFPAEVDLEPGVVHRLAASKSGYRDFKMKIEVTAGQDREFIEIDLRRGSSRRRSGKSASKSKRKKSRKSKKSKRSEGDPTMGRLTLRSTPASNVILNGRPIGKTPQIRVSVPGNSLQTVVFVHPEKGRKRAQKYVKAGESQTVSIRF